MRNKATEKPMRKVNALAMRLARVCSAFASPCALPRIMKNRAAAKLPKIAMKASATRTFMLTLSLASAPLRSALRQGFGA